MQLIKGTLGMLAVTVIGTVIVLLMANGVRMINKLFTKLHGSHEKFTKEGM